MKRYEGPVEQLKKLMVKEEEGKKHKHVPAKRVDVVSLRLVKESSLLYKNRSIQALRMRMYDCYCR